MKTGKIVLGLIGLGVVSSVIWAISLINGYNTKFVTGQSFQMNCEVVFDNTWKKIQQQIGVANEYKDGFKEVYVAYMDVQFKNDSGAGQQTLMKWITQAVPTFDASLYKTLMNTIEGSRNEFTMEQKKLIDIDRELKSMKVKFPNSLLLSGKADLNIKLVTSAKTDEVYSTGQENDIDLFQ